MKRVKTFKFKVAPVKHPRVPKVPVDLPPELLIQAYSKYKELEEVKEIEKTKREFIREWGETTRHKIDKTVSLANKVIEKNYQLRREEIDVLAKKLEKADTVEEIAVLVNGMVEITNSGKLEEELEAISKLLDSDGPIEI